MSDLNQSGLQIIKRHYASLSDVERRIADYILENPQKVINMTTNTLSAEVGVSEGSIINFSNRIGFEGFTKMKINIAQNLTEINHLMFDDITPEDNPKAALHKVMSNAIAAFQSTYDIISSEDLMKTIEILMNAKKIEIYGVASSSTVAQDAYFRFMQVGLPAYAVTDALICSISASMLDGECAVVGISHSGRTVETLKAIEIAKSRKAKTIGITSYSRSPLAQLCDVSIIIASKEAEENKEAVVSRLTQLMVLDSICSLISCRRKDTAITLMQNTIDIYGEHRK